MKRKTAPLRSHLFPRWALFVLCTLILIPSAHSEGRPAAPLPATVQLAIENFLRGQTAGLPGTVSVRVETPRSGPLPACATPEIFLPQGTRPWGRISVGVRCAVERPWTRYVPAYIAVQGVYYTAAHPIRAGQRLALSDASRREADLTRLPRHIVVDPAQFDGAIALNPIAAGAPMRQESLRLPAAIQQGQLVKVSAQGSGFVVTAEGKAVASAAVGARIQVKMRDGQVLSGLVNPDGTVERFN